MWTPMGLWGKHAKLQSVRLSKDFLTVFQSSNTSATILQLFSFCNHSLNRRFDRKQQAWRSLAIGHCKWLPHAFWMTLCIHQTKNMVLFCHCNSPRNAMFHYCLAVWPTSNTSSQLLAGCHVDPIIDFGLDPKKHAYRISNTNFINILNDSTRTGTYRNTAPLSFLLDIGIQLDCILNPHIGLGTFGCAGPPALPRCAPRPVSLALGAPRLNSRSPPKEANTTNGT